MIELITLPVMDGACLSSSQTNGIARQPIFRAN
jgi:hypothetical protein